MAAKFVEHGFKVGKSIVKCAAEVKGREIVPMMKLQNGNVISLGAGSVPVMSDDKGAVPATLADVKAAFVAGLKGPSRGMDDKQAEAEWASVQGQPVSVPVKVPK